MSKLSKDAFAIMAICDKTKKHYGITIDPRNDKYVFCWGFKVKEDQGKREGYDQKKVHGQVAVDADFNGCPYCGSKQFTLCMVCGKIACWNGQEVVTCPNCGATSAIQRAESVDLSGAGF